MSFCHKSVDIQPTREMLALDEIDSTVEGFLLLWEQTVRALETVRDQTSSRGHTQQADILQAQISILEDPLLGKRVTEKIAAGKNMAWAVQETFNEFATAFEKMSSSYIRERVVDLHDVGERLLRSIMQVPEPSFAEMCDPAIVIASHLTASDIAQLDFSKVLGLVLEIGSKTSHTAIIARGQGIPVIVGMSEISSKISSGNLIAIDGETGQLWLHPTKDHLNALRGKDEQASLRNRRYAKEVDLPCRTLDGNEITLGANVGGAEEIPLALKNGADEIGLFRTEFVFLERRELPNIEEQFLIYRAVAECMRQKPVIIRTLDVGGDKKIPGVVLEKEDNPFLGVRGIRLCLANMEIFRMQLAAILRASAFGRLKIMIPMVTNIDEVLATKVIIREVGEELKAQYIDFDPEIPVGIMVEVPVTAMQIHAFAPHVDFFSIGTNDLLQYSLAVDRGNPKLSSLYDPCHPAFLSLVARIIKEAHAAKRPVGMCGELAGDPRFTLFLLGVGLDEFSMSSSAIPGIKYLIRHVSKQEAETAAAQILRMDRAQDIRAFLHESNKQINDRIEEWCTHEQ
jgi:phosphotransferase system enzyme I (PtsI)